jgi:hypothetical protein
MAGRFISYVPFSVSQPSMLSQPESSFSQQSLPVASDFVDPSPIFTLYKSDIRMPPCSWSVAYRPMIPRRTDRYTTFMVQPSSG